MENADSNSSVDDNLSSERGRQYHQVVNKDRAFLPISSADTVGPSPVMVNRQNSSQKEKVMSGSNIGTNASTHSRSQRESKLDLFGFDSLINILGIKSMTGEQIPAPSSPDGEDISITLEHSKPNVVKLGTMMGVFVPCLQNILGIIYYIRFSWIVGMAGIGESLILVSFCCLCTLSAIATNGAMKGGGPYYLIGRALGPEVGVSTGLCFFLGNAVAGALSVIQGDSPFYPTSEWGMEVDLVIYTIEQMGHHGGRIPQTSASLEDLKSQSSGL